MVASGWPYPDSFQSISMSLAGSCSSHFINYTSSAVLMWFTAATQISPLLHSGGEEIFVRHLINGDRLVIYFISRHCIFGLRFSVVKEERIIDWIISVFLIGRMIYSLPISNRQIARSFQNNSVWFNYFWEEFIICINKWDRD